MAWFEFHQSLVTHRKLYALAGKLGVSRPTAAGHLAFLWAWALDNAPTGDLSKVDPHVIKLAADWPKKADVFCTALREAGFLDADGSLHDWWMYAGRLVEQREKDAERKRMSRRQAADSPADGGQTAAVEDREYPREQNTTDSSSSARDATQWFEAVTHRTPPNSVFREMLLNLDAAHPPDCLRAVFEKASDKDDPWTYGKRVFDSCLTEGHEPRERRHATSGKPVREGAARPAAGSSGGRRGVDTSGVDPAFDRFND